jgi:anaerobic carbon-monoxide dehydrogenase iron sulfur subunit
MRGKYEVKCGITGCPNDAIDDCSYCGIPLCEAHSKKLESSKDTELYCAGCYAYLIASGLKDRELDRKLFPNVLLVNSRKCTGCRTCELICSFVHSRAFSYQDSAIEVSRNEDRGTSKLNICRHCEDPECVKVCPAGALSKNKDTGFVTYDTDKCTECMLCIDACPYNAIHEHNGRIIKCDLCQGEPMCVRYCPAEAIEWIKKYRIGERRKLVYFFNSDSEEP